MKYKVAAIVVLAFVIGFVVGRSIGKATQNGENPKVDTAEVEEVQTSLPVESSSRPQDLPRARDRAVPESAEEAPAPTPNALSLERTSADGGKETVIEAKPAAAAAGRLGIVNILTKDQADKETVGKKKLEDVDKAFDTGVNAVEALGEQLSALNGTYVGEVLREGKAPCPTTFSLDGVYKAASAEEGPTYVGKTVMDYLCDGSVSRGSTSELGEIARVVGDDSKALLLQDGGRNFFHLTFSEDFQVVTGSVYRGSQSKKPSYVGRLLLRKQN